MTRINGTQLVTFDADYPHGHLGPSIALVGAACDAFFLSRGMPVAEFGDHFRRQIRSQCHRAKASRQRQRITQAI